MSTRMFVTSGFVAAMAIGAPAAGGAPVFETLKLVPEESPAGSLFGNAIAVDGAIAVIGAFQDVTQGTSAGIAWVADVDTGVLLASLLPDEIDAFDRFGGAVAIDGRLAAIGAAGDDDFGFDAGAVYLYDLTVPATPLLVAKVVAPGGAPNDFFGSAVALSDGILAVGATGSDLATLDAGAVFVYDVSDPTDPVHQGTLLASDAGVFDLLGGAVALDGDRLAAGAILDDDQGTDAGAVYVFDIALDDRADGGDTDDDGDAAEATSGPEGGEILKLTAPDGDASAFFGVAVAMDCGRVVVGASGGSHAYVFDAVTGTLDHLLAPPDASKSGQFGRTVAISGTRIAVAAPGASPGGVGGAGAVIVYDRGSGDPVATLLASDGAANDGLGWGVGLDGARAVVGAMYEDEAGLDVGAAYVFTIDTGADLNGDGVVGIADLVRLLATWGGCPDPTKLACGSDLDGDGAVGCTDLCLMLAVWG